MALICDTGPLYAAIDRSDRQHAACARLLREIDEPVLVPAPVVVELDWLGASRRSTEILDVFLKSMEDESVAVEALDRDDYIRVRELCQQYADLPLGFVDAAVIAVAERLSEPKIATLDRRHFTVVRPRHVPAFALLPD